MRLALAPTGEDPLGKMVIRGDRVTAVESETQKTILLPPFLRRKFVKIAITTLVVIVLFPVWSVVATSWNNTEHLFFIERSKNKNVVQYDVQLMENNDLREPSPMVVYWAWKMADKKD